jgi:N-succinyldiaminopimelate aminotransferase
MPTKSYVSEKLQTFGTTIFSEMTRLALANQAINLSQGFPDFEGPNTIIEHVIKALQSGHNQYARSQGHPLLTEALAKQTEELWGLSYEPASEVVITSGATEAIASALIGLLNPGDEVILFEPYYDSYPASILMGGGIPKYCTLEFPEFALDEEKLRALVSDRTRVIVINTPHNPSGKVFSQAELEVIAKICQEHDLIVISDEVYEFLTYDDAEHISIAKIDGMFERTLRISSAGKSYSFTGWKIGWAMGPAPLVAAVQAAHQFVTFATSTPVQVGLAHALNDLDPNYISDLRKQYDENRIFLCDVLEKAGLKIAKPKGTYFVIADFSEKFDGNDKEFAKHLIEKHKVAAIPPSVFYSANPQAGEKLIRFAFCKKPETLRAAAKRLANL